MAIAFDTAVDGGVTTGTSLTWSHTCTGSDRSLRVGVRGTTSPSNNITGITYAGVALTKIAESNNTAERWVSLWELLNPASGANNVVVSSSPSDVIIGLSASYTGVSATYDATTTATGSATASLACSVTPIADNCWVQGVWGNGAGAPSAGTGATERISTSNGLGLYDNNAAITPAAATSMTVTSAGSPNPIAIVASMVPVASGGTSPKRLSLLGVG